MTATQTREAAVIEEKLRALMDALGISLPRGELRFVTPARAVLLDFFDEHPFARIDELEIHNGDPSAWSQKVEDRVTLKFRAG